jgi:hypothetical protein
VSEYDFDKGKCYLWYGDRIYKEEKGYLSKRAGYASLLVKSKHQGEIPEPRNQTERSRKAE